MPITGAINANENLAKWVGDATSVTDGQTYTATTQHISGSDSPYASIVGDVFFNSSNGSTVLGAGDVMNVAGNYIVGDVSWVGENATRTVGGNDKITMLENPFYRMAEFYPDSYKVTGDVSRTYSLVIGGNDTIIGFLGEDMPGSFYGDIKDVESGADVEGGRDVIKATNIADEIYGDFEVVSSGATAKYENDRIWGYGGNDRIFGDVNSVSDTFSRAGDDTIYGGGGNDVIYGDFNILLRSNSSQPTIYNGGTKNGGDDTLYGGAGKDRIIGGGGDDLIKGGAGDDDIVGGWGKDDVQGGGGADQIRGGRGNDTLSGGGGADLILGGRGNDTLSGGVGADRLYAEHGNDVMRGGKGDDTLYFNSGKDVGTGGLGADTFRFTDTRTANWFAVIKDFNSAQGDKIDFSDVADIKGWNDLKTHHLMAGSDNAAVIYTNAGVEQVQLTGVSIDDLSANDFIF